MGPCLNECWETPCRKLIVSRRRGLDRDVGSGVISGALDYDKLWVTTFSGLVHTNPNKFENALFFSLVWPTVHTKTAFPVTENGAFQKRSPEWRILKTPAKWCQSGEQVPVDGAITSPISV